MSDSQSLPKKRESTEDDSKATKKAKLPEKNATKKPIESESEEDNIVDDSDEEDFDDDDEEDFDEDDDFEANSEEEDELASEEESFSDDSSLEKKKKPKGKK